jgi:hypothetical protein
MIATLQGKYTKNPPYHQRYGETFVIIYESRYSYGAIPTSFLNSRVKY